MGRVLEAVERQVTEEMNLRQHPNYEKLFFRQTQPKLLDRTVCQHFQKFWNASGLDIMMAALIFLNNGSSTDKINYTFILT